MRKVACELVRCDTSTQGACGLLQMKYSVPPEILYSTYWYRSGTNQTMRDHLAGIVGDTRVLVPKKFGAALDIGCNDGTLLSNYPKSWKKVGVDPSNVTVCHAVEVVRDTFPSLSLDRNPKLAKLRFDVITSIAMFYDLEDPVQFAQAVRRRLTDNGVWIVEVAYLPTMLANNAYDTICNEHLEYYSLAVLERIFQEAGLKCFRAELNTINGGSIRCFVCRRECPDFDAPKWKAELQNLRREEFDLELDTDRPYLEFQKRIERHRIELLHTITELKKSGKRIHVYGASTKGNTLLQWCDLDHHLIDFAADRNPDKHLALTVGTKIPIISEETSRKMKPDYYLVLPWHFKEEFLEREKAELDRGCGFIFPLPEIEVVKGVPF